MCSIGTSSCDILLSKEKILIPGIAGIIKDGIIENFYAYEAGQAAVGDIFSWFVENLVPKSYIDKAIEQNMHIYDYLEDLIKEIPSGETGLLALDWFNGNRSTLMDSELSGVLLGLRINTKPEHIYRALIESTAFGKKIIMDQFEKNGIKINNVVFAGGLPQKNNEFNKIYSDILDKRIIISEYSENGAVGSAIFSAVAAKEFNSLQDATKILKLHNNVIEPNKENVKKYKDLYEVYKNIYEYFGTETEILKNV